MLHIRRGSTRQSEKDYIAQENLLVYTANVRDPDSSSSQGGNNVDCAEVAVTAGPQGLQALLLLGVKLNEPVLMDGPFVQSSQGE